MLVTFITHPDVVIDPAVPVPQWHLSSRGLERMAELARHPWVAGIQCIYCSEEQKAVDGAEVLARLCGAPVIHQADLGENDRSSTGYLPKHEFEPVVDEFFRWPEVSVRGWETAAAAQARIVQAVRRVAAEAGPATSVAIVSHGGVGGLLMCHLKGTRISRQEDQPPGAGGNYFQFELPSAQLVCPWKSIDPRASPIVHNATPR